MPRRRLSNARLTGTDGLRIAVTSKDRTSVVQQRKDIVLQALRDAGTDVALTRLQIEDLTGVPVYTHLNWATDLDPLNLLIAEGLVGVLFEHARENQLYYAEETNAE